MERLKYKGHSMKLEHGKVYDCTVSKNENTGFIYLSVHLTDPHRVYLRYATEKEFRNEWKTTEPVFTYNRRRK